MKVKKAILEVMEEVLGLDQAELEEDLDLDLFENDLLDSLSLITVISEVEAKIGRGIEIKKIGPDEFRTINKLAAAIEAQE